MPTIVLVTTIACPIERCFDLSRSVDLHIASASSTRERVVAGVRSGIVSQGDTITWRARHLGWTFDFTSEITTVDRPHLFVDRMVKGPFRSFEHEHWFEARGEETHMRDVLRFASPLWLLGRIMEMSVLERHLRSFLLQRNAVLKEVAESENLWQRYIGA